MLLFTRIYLTRPFDMGNVEYILRIVKCLHNTTPRLIEASKTSFHKQVLEYVLLG